ncbi:MAG TPA: DNA alkylation repair protein [Rubrivivax sp.]|nr:DNA alkylation repair protein [Rubrivivax sp.]
MEPFKNLLNPALVRQAAQRLQSRQFDTARFAAMATQGLEALEMKARAMQICAALEATLPADFLAAADLLEAALAPPEAGEKMGELIGIEGGLRGWILWPVGEYVARQGLQQPQRALVLLHALTQRFTAEFAIRPFIVEHPKLVFQTLAGWTQDPSHHVRRLVSEGSRPRLPWGLQLKALIEDPSPTLPLLRALQDDPSDYVRRSVANHLNDIAKDHPALIASWLGEHLPQASPQRRALLKHASRTLIKRGDPDVLGAWGLAAALRGEVELTLEPSQVIVGGGASLTLRLRSSSPRPQRLAIDYAVHHVTARGGTSARVFKGWLIELPAHGELTLSRRHSMKLVTTRRYHPGRHVVTVQVNGRTVAEAAFELLLPTP